MALKNQQTKKTLQTPTAETQEQSTTTKIKSKYIYIILSAIFAAAFFSHEFIPDEIQEEIQAIQKHTEQKSKRTFHLNEVKKLSIGTDEYANYLKYKKSTDKAHKEVLQIQKKQEFRGFEDFQQFLGEFNWAFALFLYTLFNLKNVIRKDEFNKWELLFHLNITFISIYFICWAISPPSFQDYEKVTYLLYALGFSILSALSMYFIVLKSQKREAELTENIQRLIGFVFRVRNEHYKTVAKKAMHAEMYNKAKLTNDSVKQNADDFEEDLFETLETIK